MKNLCFIESCKIKKKDVRYSARNQLAEIWFLLSDTKVLQSLGGFLIKNYMIAKRCLFCHFEVRKMDRVTLRRQGGVSFLENSVPPFPEKRHRQIVFRFYEKTLQSLAKERGTNNFYI